MKRHKVTRARIGRVWMRLQNIAFSSNVAANHRCLIRDAMDLLDDVRSDMRRKEIFVAGARARKPVATFDRQALGSFEAMTFYDGYASTHPKFTNPYRRTP